MIIYNDEIIPQFLILESSVSRRRSVRVAIDKLNIV